MGILNKHEELEKQKLEFKKQQKYPTLFLLFMLGFVGFLFWVAFWWSRNHV